MPSLFMCSDLYIPPSPPLVPQPADQTTLVPLRQPATPPPAPPPPAAPTLVSRSFTNGNFQLKVASTTNTGFGLLASTNLTDWTHIAAGFTDTNGSLLFQDTNAAHFPRRFYRAYWPFP